jgi:hypothetical protein
LADSPIKLILKELIFINAPSLTEKTTSSSAPKLLDQVVAKIRFNHYSRRKMQSPMTAMV